ASRAPPPSPWTPSSCAPCSSPPSCTSSAAPSGGCPAGWTPVCRGSASSRPRAAPPMRGWPTSWRSSTRSGGTMYAISLGDDGAELRPLEPWHAEEFLAHLERGRDFINQYIPFAATATDTAGARAVLQRYADMRAAD